ncbi:MAG TPA: acyl-CoA desaturase [Ktedonobacteraceae bacterium]|nr:acyl-CoA desaturase [Ktedonobacteraceae bacterium]
MRSLTIKKFVMIVVVVLPFLATLFAIALLWQRAVNWTDIELLIAFNVIAGLGITIGFHRMLTHRSFQPHPVVKFIFLAFGSMAVEGPGLQWAATHIKHHAHSDREGDPHSPVEGFWHAHLGWMFNINDADPNVYCRNLVRDPMVIFMSSTFILWVILSLAIPFAIGGWTGLLWGGLVRIFFTHHITWSVNSVCHTFGKREFETRDRSRNEWVVGLLGFGEGWHNNHHAFPRSAFHGLHWWQFDLSGYVIWTLERVGLVRDVYRVSPAMRARYSSKKIEVESEVAIPLDVDMVPENSLV